MTSQQRCIVHALSFSAIALMVSFPAQATATRTFVSTTGSDANVSSNCSPAAPCRTFGVAISVTNPGGEVVVLSSGGYGAFSITQPVIITAIGVDASISLFASGAGITVNTSGAVTLVGLNLHGEATGTNGILVNQVNSLRLYNVSVENFTNDGIDFNSTGSLAVYNSSVYNNTQNGLQLEQGFGYAEGSAFDKNGHGLEVDAGQLTVADSSANLNFGAYVAVGGTMTLYNDRATFSNMGLVTSGGTLYFANCLIANNGTAYNIVSGTMAGTSPGTSFIAPGQIKTGTLSTAITLE